MYFSLKINPLSLIGINLNKLIFYLMNRLTVIRLEQQICQIVVNHLSHFSKGKQGKDTTSFTLSWSSLRSLLFFPTFSTFFLMFFRLTRGGRASPWGKIFFKFDP